MYKIALSAKNKRKRGESLEILGEIQRALTSVRSCRIDEEKFKKDSSGRRKAERISRHANAMARIESEARHLTTLTRPIIWENDQKKRLPKPKCRSKWHSYLLKHTKSEDDFAHEMSWLEEQKNVLNMMHGGSTFIKLA